VDGSNEKQLTNFSNNGSQVQFPKNPVFNSDSTKIIFISTSSYNGGPLKMMNLDGTNVTAVGQNTGSNYYTVLLCQNRQKLLFSQDTIIFGTSTIAYQQIFTSNIDGSNLQKLTSVSGLGGMPDKDCLLGSVYQNKIAYLHQESPGTNGYPVYEIYTMNLDGSNKTRLTVNNLDKVSATFSPDGSKIAFAAKVDGTRQNAHSEIFVMNADGSNIVQLTSYSNGGSLPVRTDAQSFSKDGQTIYYSSDEAYVGKASQLYKMNLDGTGKTKITSVDNSTYKFNFLLK
jgi:Tol biopolymer transport system component